jgi:hypothetical protein
MQNVKVPNISSACASLQKEIREKSNKLNIDLPVELPSFKPPPGSTSKQPPRDVFSLTYDCLYAVMEELMLVEAKKGSADQTASYLGRIKKVWEGERNVAAYLSGDALEFWNKYFPRDV